jgi:hypothetical protein
MGGLLEADAMLRPVFCILVCIPFKVYRYIYSLYIQHAREKGSGTLYTSVDDLGG